MMKTKPPTRARRMPKAIDRQAACPAGGLRAVVRWRAAHHGARSSASSPEHGLRVELAREVGWATIRDKLIYGELDAAHAPAGMVFAATFGLGSIAVPCLTALVLEPPGKRHHAFGKPVARGCA